MGKLLRNSFFDDYNAAVIEIEELFVFNLCRATLTSRLVLRSFLVVRTLRLR